MTEAPLARLLVIDDQPHVRAMISLILRAANFEVVGAEGATTALQESEKSNFDLAIVDIFMPGIDGVNLIKLLRARNPDLAVIAISGVPLKSSGRTALEFLPMLPSLANVVCLQKPFRPPELLQAVRQALVTPTIKEALAEQGCP
jgi:CheY-like chemotaxis protein